MEQTIVLIPALNPLPTIVHFVEKLKTLAIEKIIIINDGSDLKYNEIFKQLLKQECIVLTHERNIGKGQALKTGMNYIVKSTLNAKGVVTVGAHGQHSILDVEQILASTKIFSDGIVLGIRDFKGSDYPIISQIQNRASSMLFELFFHKRLLDTQTGLRYIPREHLSWLLKVNGESFRYDTNMLVEAIKRKVPLYEVPIGHAKLRKNSIIYYDEVTNHAQILQQMWNNFFHKGNSTNETFSKRKRK
ncbi:glycosyltransferase family 2 protein [Solibacillus sp. MA9]|uniref:Glycosyltransferase family 2 protein n=1 Tax=Solibacillus palustris TaxID=2908203 RepID=A0ABS9UIF4_9BACL|nr:glycosyltransferase family 2 protein [Solibacillus sp. MA9]MCH7323768.1 glycosyltransferase family 2 protein [Solibacillus sp. MA9]